MCRPVSHLIALCKGMQSPAGHDQSKMALISKRLTLAKARLAETLRSTRHLSPTMFLICRVCWYWVMKVSRLYIYILYKQ